MKKRRYVILENSLCRVELFHYDGISGYYLLKVRPWNPYFRSFKENSIERKVRRYDELTFLTEDQLESAKLLYS